MSTSAELLIAVAQAEPPVDVVPERLHRTDRAEQREIPVEDVVRRHVAGGDDVRLPITLDRVLLLEVDEDAVGELFGDLLAVVLVECDQVGFSSAGDPEENDCLRGLRDVGQLDGEAELLQAAEDLVGLEMSPGCRYSRGHQIASSLGTADPF